MKTVINTFLALLMLAIFSSCSLVGIQKEKGPKYIVILKKGNFEVREYESYIVAETTVLGSEDKSSGDAFRILAGYIFGGNKEKKQISMTAPVEMKQISQNHTMRFSMPEKYTLESLPKSDDNRIKFIKVKRKLVAAHIFSGSRSKEKNEKKANELRAWLRQLADYKYQDSYSFAGYNPPWTIPFFRKNEILIQLEKKEIK